MSDLSGMEQSFALPSLTQMGWEALPPAGPEMPPRRPRSFDVQLDEIEFRRLHAADEIGAIQKLRGEIQLPGAALADPGFIAREKKETGKESSARSNGVTSSSAR